MEDYESLGASRVVDSPFWWGGHGNGVCFGPGLVPRSSFYDERVADCWGLLVPLGRGSLHVCILAMERV